MKYYGYDLEIDLNADRKRFWLGTLCAINYESNDSMPISQNHFEIVKKGFELTSGFKNKITIVLRKRD